VPPDAWVGWDLGGAHIKAVRLGGAGVVEEVVQVPCPLWEGVDRLEEGIDRVLERLGKPRMRHAVTMTGELVDLFDDRARGVEALVGAMRRRFPDDDLRIYAGPCGLLAPSAALDVVEQVASANWLATAFFIAGRLPAGLLVDIGSTTTDLVPFSGGRVTARGYSDHERLEQEELVYTGVVRTPVMAVARRAPIDGRWLPLMAEQFATMADVYRLTAELPGHADLLPSADGRDKTIAASARRLARMVGMDAETADPAAWRGLAGYVAGRQLGTIADACARMLSRGELSDDAPLVGAGVGSFLAKRLAERVAKRYVGFQEFFTSAPSSGLAVSDCAPAAAVAGLAACDGFGR
jgi:probable H4MPT-linked C1 transfer pathway protein